MDLTVTLPAPHAKQAAIIDHPAKRKVICAGRRFGKTHMAAMVGVYKMLEGRRVLFGSPTQEQVDTFWELSKEWLRELIDMRLIYKNESKRLMAFNHNGGRIKAKTAWNADTMRGDYGDFIVLDEFAQMHPGVWDFVVSPMMLDTDGDTWFISTPLRRNHFFQMYQKALQDDTGRWAHFYATSYDNPHLSTIALEEITADMSSTAYQQEIMAEFLENEGAVFRNIEACLHAAGTYTYDDVRKHYVVAGIDWGKQNDYTVCSVFDADLGEELELVRFNKIDYTYQRDHIKAVCEAFGVTHVWAEANAMGTPNIEQLQRDGLDVIPFMTTATSKGQLIENLALAFDRAEAQWLDMPVATGELESYERKVSAVTGRSQYSAPEGLHDDTVIARALAWWAVTNRPVLPVQRVPQSGLYRRGNGNGKSGPRA